ncbi:4'-phosphopantetheinyl transferase family protein [Paracoccus sulfuroxidans]|uniref:4'-phosphopantetheinyl transferase N-terminal domain-containing protein n=1 Tax=Paracoccus sulfuroxidans TaxID=384678 RepID=A0A562NVH5_9RHOB|nr:4-phosphopantetheinyl transferase [Paracoccus sulfuroxidans]TWI35706.1 hypothetical protein IQ24_01064 [Paracoccus sulfuroxidans]
MSETETEALRQTAQRLLPPGFGCAVLPISAIAPPLLPAERVEIARAVPKRAHEFALGRAVLRRAIAEAGHLLSPETPITVLPDRRPRLPAGIRASLSHSNGFCIAIAAPVGGAHPGVDIELTDQACAPTDLQQMVAPARGRGAEVPPLLIFSAKEAAFKAQYPLTQEMLDFSDAAMVLSGDRFRARLPGGRILSGRWAECSGHYLSISLCAG